MRAAFFLLVLGTTSFTWIDAARADYGEGVLALRCDSKLRLFEIEPRISWNDELEQLQPVFDLASGRAESGGYEIHSAKKSKALGGVCKVGRTTVSARIVNRWNDPTLELRQDKSLVASILVDDVWRFSGYVFRVRFRKDAGWEQMCGREESELKWQPLDTLRKDTNCRSDRQ